jgi:hypothetical protein
MLPADKGDPCAGDGDCRDVVGVALLVGLDCQPRLAGKGSNRLDRPRTAADPIGGAIRLRARFVVALVLLVDPDLGIIELPVFVQRHSGRRIRDLAAIVRVDAVRVVDQAEAKVDRSAGIRGAGIPLAGRVGTVGDGRIRTGVAVGGVGAEEVDVGLIAPAAAARVVVAVVEVVVLPVAAAAAGVFEAVGITRDRIGARVGQRADGLYGRSGPLRVRCTFS